MMKNANLKQLDRVLFVLLLIVSSVVTLYLFYRQAFAEGGRYYSDMQPYIAELMGTQTTYDFPYPILFKMAGILYLFIDSPEWAMIIAVWLFNISAICIVKIYICRQTRTTILSTVCSFALFFLSMIYFPILPFAGIKYKYLGVFSCNPWQNATYIASRPFMVLTFIYGIMTLESYEEELAKQVNMKMLTKYYLLSLFSLLATLTKPSYTIVHLATVGVIMLYRFGKKKLHVMRQSILLACCYIPTLLALLYQYKGVFAGKTIDDVNKGIGFGVLRVWSLYSDNVFVSVILAILFPISVLICNIKQLKTNMAFSFSWIAYLTSFMMAASLYERGFRETHFNFAWGYMCALFILFLSSIIVLIKETIYKFKSNIFKVIIQWAFLFVHTVYGIYYFYILYMGGSYLC